MLIPMCGTRISAKTNKLRLYLPPPNCTLQKRFFHAQSKERDSQQWACQTEHALAYTLNTRRM